MSATTQLTDFSDLYTDLLNRTRNDTSATATVNQAKRYINIALFDMHIGFGEKFPWAERRAVLRTHASYSTGTVAATQGSNSIVGTGTAWNTNNAFAEANLRVGGKISIGGSDEVYELSAVGSDTTATLETLFIGTTVTVATYTYFEDEYDLASDFLRPIDQTRFSKGGIPIALVGRQEFRSRYPRNHITGLSWVATIIDLPFSGNTTPVRNVRLHPPPDSAYQINYRYVTSNLATNSAGVAQAQLSVDADEPIIPLRYRHVLVLHALYHWYRDKKNDTRANEAKAEYFDLLQRIAGDTEIGQQNMSIAPRVATYRSRARRPWSPGGGRYDLDNRFDRLEDRR